MTKHKAEDRKRLWLPSTLVAVSMGVIWLIIGGGASCDSTAKFKVRDRKFTDIQVVSAFPVRIEDDGTSKRICGAPLDGEIALEPNAMELTVNFVGTALNSPLCGNDSDLSIKEGEFIELLPVKTTEPGAKVGVGNFPINIDCVDNRTAVPQGGITGCNSLITNLSPKPTQVRYENLIDRCDEDREDTRLNVALLVDHSGSIAGFVDKETLLEDQLNDTDAPSPLEPSDSGHARIRAAGRLLDSLNSRDRAIGYFFDEEWGAAVAASDQRACEGGSRNGKRCLHNHQCPGATAECKQGSGDPANPVLDTFMEKSLTEAEQIAFGSNADTRAYLKTALDYKVKYAGDGRAPLWHGVQTAYNFIKKGDLGSSKGRHIIVITDGPDTCSHSENFAYSNSAKKCRLPCGTADADFSAVLKLMHLDKYPVHLHFIQFQAQAQDYRRPDPHMMEIACRSGGTYQFINSQEMNVKASDFANAMERAALRVRYALSGNWRVTFKMPHFGPTKEIKAGSLFAIRGHLQFKNERFASLDSIYSSTTTSAWRFGVHAGNEDRRLLFRTSCVTNADCMGTGDCAANHCSSSGLCIAAPAQDRAPCNDGKGVCCGGSCNTQDDCKKNCK